jgi:ParB family transcriptional regulator, chromosome partitioning protein
MNQIDTTNIQMIPISGVDVLNPRERNKKKFKEMVENISKVGLKKPITVSLQPGTDPPRYYLACGQGRMEAYIALEQKKIPAVVVEATQEECMIISLVENVARRSHRPMELLNAVQTLKKRGHSSQAISQKIGMPEKSVSGILTLMEKGEDGLIRAVIKDRIPITVAALIASVEEKEGQEALQAAYESEGLRGRKLQQAKKIVEQRFRLGPKLTAPRGNNQSKEQVTGKTLASFIQQEADRRRSLIRRSERVRNSILFITSATHKLRSDPNFINLLRAVGLMDMPELLDERVNQLKGVK